MARKKSEKLVQEERDNSKNLMKKIVKILDDKLASEIEVIDVSSLTSLCRYFIICSGESNVQLKAIAEEVQYRLKHEDKVRPLNIEGLPDSGWILLDYVDIIVHVFLGDLREFYRLERLWGQGEFLKLDKILKQRGSKDEDKD